MSKRTTHQGWLIWQIAPDSPSGLRWFYRHGQQQGVEGQTQENLPPLDEVRSLLLLPAEEVTLHNLTLAGGKLDALKWQLEPLLLEDIEDLHILPVQREGQQQLLAVTSPTKLNAHCEALRAMGFEAERAIPELLLVPPGKVLQCDDNSRLVRLPDGTGLKLAALELSQLQPDFPALAALESQPNGSLSQLAEAAIASHFNLLPPKTARQIPARALALLGIAAALLSISWLAEPLWQGWQNQRQLAQINQQVLARYQHYFPEETPSRPRQQFSRKLNQLEAVEQQPGLLALLRENAAQLNKHGQNPLKKLSWDASTQQLRLTFSRPLAAKSENGTIKIDNNMMTLEKKP